MTEIPRYITDIPQARRATAAQQQRIRLADAVAVLRRHAEGRLPHRQYVACPTVGRHDSRDPLCAVCAALKTLET